MSVLTDKLDYIVNWVESKRLDLFDYYSPGLSVDEIDKLTQNLSFSIPDEFYELYQWRNGLDFFNSGYSELFLFPEQLYNHEPLEFSDLETCIIDFHSICSEFTLDNEFWSDKWFPFASFEGKRMLYFIGDLNPSPIYLWDLDSQPNQVRVYKSLTSMMSVIAECCEKNVYHVFPDPYDDDEERQMLIRINETKLDLEKEIFQKYNPMP